MYRVGIGAWLDTGAGVSLVGYRIFVWSYLYCLHDFTVLVFFSSIISG